jgi:hypothetical protein
MAWGKSLWASGEGSPSPSRTAVSPQWFPPLDATRHLAIWKALKDLIARLKVEPTKSKARTELFNHFPGKTIEGFIEYLERGAEIYDGTNSTFCWVTLRDGGWKPSCWFNTVTVTEKVMDKFTSDAKLYAASWRGRSPTVLFFGPTAIGFNSSGSSLTLGNEGHLFHEALHGYLNLSDLFISGPLGVPDFPSCLISNYVQSHVLAFSTDLDSTVHTQCP